MILNLYGPFDPWFERKWQNDCQVVWFPGALHTHETCTITAWIRASIRLRWHEKKSVAFQGHTLYGRCSYMLIMTSCFQLRLLRALSFNPMFLERALLDTEWHSLVKLSHAGAWNQVKFINSFILKNKVDLECRSQPKLDVSYYFFFSRARALQELPCEKHPQKRR